MSTITYIHPLLVPSFLLKLYFRSLDLAIEIYVLYSVAFQFRGFNLLINLWFAEPNFDKFLGRESIFYVAELCNVDNIDSGHINILIAIALYFIPTLEFVLVGTDPNDDNLIFKCSNRILIA